ncbi:hypothetical protein AMECASPLE_021853 [Ameca splendens]|uniref:Small subunit ribosomal protein S11e n=1 Tax=Ameca splendens TaxID=208324 RepID=A0ABV0Z1P2_9TELE
MGGAEESQITGTGHGWKVNEQAQVITSMRTRSQFHAVFHQSEVQKTGKSHGTRMGAGVTKVKKQAKVITQGANCGLFTTLSTEVRRQHQKVTATMQLNDGIACLATG